MSTPEKASTGEPVACRYRRKGNRSWTLALEVPDWAPLSPDIEFEYLYASPPSDAGLREALSWALEYLEGYDHVGTGSHPPETFLRNYEERLEIIRMMLGKQRQHPRWKLADHFRAALQSGRTSALSATEQR